MDGASVERHALSVYPQQRETVRILQGSGWVLKPVWTGADYLARIWFRFPEYGAPSKSLHQLRSIEHLLCACLY